MRSGLSKGAGAGGAHLKVCAVDSGSQSYSGDSLGRGTHLEVSPQVWEDKETAITREAGGKQGHEECHGSQKLGVMI